MSDTKKHWTRINTEEIFKSPFFRFRRDEARLPDGRICPRYYVIEFNDWVNIVPITKDGRVVLVSQYRHAVEDVCLEIPGGALDPHEKGSHEAAARRELVEETGYVPEKMILLGAHRPNPALQNNLLYTYLALGCEKKSEQSLDAYEDIEVETATVEQVLGFIKDGTINHSLVIAGIHLALPHLEKMP